MNDFNDLSMLQKRVLTYVKAFLNNNGYSPSVRDIAKGCDIKSTSTVHNALNVLESKGYITRDGGQSRTTVLTGIRQESGVYSIPLQTVDESGGSFGIIDVPKSLIQSREGVFAFRSVCDFKTKSIEKGDILIVKSIREAKKGDFLLLEDYSLCVFDESEQCNVLGKVQVCIRHFDS